MFFRIRTLLFIIIIFCFLFNLYADDSKPVTIDQVFSLLKTMSIDEIIELIKENKADFSVLTTDKELFTLIAAGATMELINAINNNQVIKLSVTEPPDGFESNQYVVLLKGLSPIFKDKYLWVFSHKIDLVGMWWPQEHAVHVDEDTNKWSARISLGDKRDINCKFEIVVMWVDSTTHKELQKYIKDAPKNNWPPIDLPEGTPSIKHYIYKIGH